MSRINTKSSLAGYNSLLAHSNNPVLSQPTFATSTDIDFMLAKEKKVEVVTQKNEVLDKDGHMYCTLCHARWPGTPEYHTCKYAVDIQDIEYGEDGMATCTLCKFQWNGFTQHICDHWFTADIEYDDDEMATCTRCKFQWDGCAQHTCDL